MPRNGTDFGIRVSGPGDAWFPGPAGVPDGLYLGDFGPDDANPDIGDSAITETAGIGGMAMAAAPALVRFVGGEGAHPPAAPPPQARVPPRGRPPSTGPVVGVRGPP